LKSIGARELSERGGRLYLGFAQGFVDEGGRLTAHVLGMVRGEPKRFRLTPDKGLVYTMRAEAACRPDQVALPGTDFSLREARFMLQEVLKGC
jgi:hypothetical protein